VGRRLALAIAGDDLLSVSAYRPKHLSLFSPLAIRRSLVPGRPISSTVALAHTRNLCPAARTSPRRDETVVPLVILVIPSRWVGQDDVYLFAW
jgi:hypothetical protein